MSIKDIMLCQQCITELWHGVEAGTTGMPCTSTTKTGDVVVNHRVFLGYVNYKA